MILELLLASIASFASITNKNIVGSNENSAYEGQQSHTQRFDEENTVHTITDTSLCSVSKKGEIFSASVSHTESVSEVSRGHIYDCYSNHVVGISNLSSSGYTNGGVSVDLDGFYANATYSLYVNNVVFDSGSFVDGDVFYNPGFYHLAVDCICGRSYSKNFTISSATVNSSEPTVHYGNQIVSDNVYSTTHQLTYQSGSLTGHVHSEMDFPESYNSGSGLLQSTLAFADYYTLVYHHKTQPYKLRADPNSTCTVSFSFLAYAPSGINNSSWAPTTLQYEGEVEMDISDAYQPDADEFGFSISLPIPYYIPNTRYSDHPIMLMYGTVEIDFDVISISSDGLPLGQFHPIDQQRGTEIDFYFYMKYKYDDVVFFGITESGWLEIANFVTSFALSLIPVVGDALSAGFDLIMLIADLANSTSEPHITIAAGDYAWNSRITLNP